jgi:predicted TIM-barrel fold metal-dependent hydrolase
VSAPAADAGGWDCHAHLFGPYMRFPLATERSYTPPEALEMQYLAMLRRLGLAPALADAGLHAELWTDCQVLPAIVDTLLALPVPVVIDHMGMFDVRAGIDNPGFRALLRLVETGRVWVKLCAYRNLLNAPDWEAGRPFQQALVTANPHRLVWGSDWPHLRVTPAPDPVQLLDMFMAWAGSDALVRQVLGANAAQLYR